VRFHDRVISQYTQFTMHNRYQTPPSMFKEAFIAERPEIEDAFNWIYIIPTLSDLDKAFAVINYPRPPQEEKSEWTLAHALNIAGVDDKTTTELIKMWEENKVEGLRVAFSNWCRYSFNKAPSSKVSL